MYAAGERPASTNTPFMESMGFKGKNGYSATGSPQSGWTDVRENDSRILQTVFRSQLYLAIIPGASMPLLEIPTLDQYVAWNNGVPPPGGVAAWRPGPTLATESSGLLTPAKLSKSAFAASLAGTPGGAAAVSAAEAEMDKAINRELVQKHTSLERSYMAINERLWADSQQACAHIKKRCSLSMKMKLKTVTNPGHPGTTATTTYTMWDATDLAVLYTAIAQVIQFRRRRPHQALIRREVPDGLRRCFGSPVEGSVIRERSRAIPP